MRLTTAILILSFALSCEINSHTKRSFRNFELFYTDTWNTAFSIKFGENDTVWVKQGFVSRRTTNIDTLLQGNAAYYALMRPAEIDWLDERISKMRFENYDSVYAEVSVKDGRMMHFHLLTDPAIKNILVTEENGPLELWDLAAWILELKQQLNWKRIDSSVSFHWREPELIIDTVKFVPLLN